MECAQINIAGGSGSASPATVSFPGAYQGEFSPFFEMFERMFMESWIRNRPWYHYQHLQQPDELHHPWARCVHLLKEHLTRPGVLCTVLPSPSI
jgi:hypothetical protein